MQVATAQAWARSLAGNVLVVVRVVVAVMVHGTPVAGEFYWASVGEESVRLLVLSISPTMMLPSNRCATQVLAYVSPGDHIHKESHLVLPTD